MDRLQGELLSETQHVLGRAPALSNLSQKTPRTERCPAPTPFCSLLIEARSPRFHHYLPKSRRLRVYWRPVEPSQIHPVGPMHSNRPANPVWCGVRVRSATELANP